MFRFVCPAGPTPHLIKERLTSLTEQNPRPDHPLPQPEPSQLRPGTQHPETSLRGRRRNRDGRPSIGPLVTREAAARRVQAGGVDGRADDGPTA